MVGNFIQPTHLILVLVVALLVLGPKRLPEAGRALGKGMREFRASLSGGDGDDAQTEPAADPRPGERQPGSGTGS